MRFNSPYAIPYGHGQEVLVQDISGMSSLRPVIDKEKCNECGTCCLYCPTGAMTYNENGVYAISVFCKGCGICAKECPVEAISLMEIKGEENG